MDNLPVSPEEIHRKEKFKERHRREAREYYWRNREKCLLKKAKEWEAKKLLPKHCVKCSAEFFAKHHRLCEDCRKQRDAARYAALLASGKPKEQGKRYYAANKERVLARHHRRYADNPQKFLSVTKKYYDKNTAKMNALGRKWRQENRPYLNEYMRRRYAAKQKLIVGDQDAVKKFYETVFSVEQISCY